MSIHVLRILRYAKQICKQGSHKDLMKGKFYYTGSRYDPEAKLATAGTIQHLKRELAEWMGVECGYKPLNQVKSRTHLLQYLPTNQNELPDRTMGDSFASALIPLSTDLELQDKYVSFLGHVRVGRLLEDMDIFAVYIAQKHILNPKQPEGKHSPYTLVTALVDKIDFTDYLPKHDKDIQISGHVTWAGTSSVEVVVWLEQIVDEQRNLLMSALFLMMVRDAATMKAAIINALKATTDEEQELIDKGSLRKEERVQTRSKSITKVIPNAKEQEILHELFIRTIDSKEENFSKLTLPPNCEWMEDYTLSNLIVVHPEHRNLHNNVFGGFIMRAALEVSYGLGYLFTNSRPLFRTISDITFNKPISLNSLIHMHAHLVCTKGKFYQIRVHTHAWNAEDSTNFTSNTFHFTYESPTNVKEIFPKTYQESMKYIDGYRNLVKSIGN
ncbi:hypothetical protein RI129_004388 [Pyrocoelia pectoralis]|uniref:HotDog ACOT-type domain-containing protein n=1 Tax=Pyrocoelia pectoralis TaxID=417401 RepID=A0AAN7VGM3_9COLE